MKKSVFLLAFALVAFAFSSIAQKTVTVDNAKSTIEWKGAKVGGSHEGTIDLKSGKLKFKDNDLVGGTFVIDMTSITNTDLEGEYKGKLEGHLKSDDFFGVEKYPTAKLEITSVTPQGPGKYKIEANITIKGTTKPIKFNADVLEADGVLTASADLTIDRSEFNVKYGSGSFFDNLGDKVIYDDFDINVKLVAGTVTGD